jgi:hypothetical protein
LAFGESDILTSSIVKQASSFRGAFFSLQERGPSSCSLEPQRVYKKILCLDSSRGAAPLCLVEAHT